MRIISGTLKSRILKTPSKKSNVRPSTDRARESLFNILTNIFDFSDKIILDLYCGTGSLGIESVSRGASYCYFIDVDTKLINENISNLNLAAVSKIIRSDVLLFLKLHLNSDIDIAFADPPYSYSKYKELLNAVSKLNLVFVLEHNDKADLDEEYNIYLLLQKKIGYTYFTIYNFRK